MLHTFLSVATVVWTVGSIIVMHRACQRKQAAQQDMNREDIASVFAADLRYASAQA